MSLLEQSQKWYPTHVKVVVIQARSLRSKGKDGTNDAYAIMQLGKEKYSSSVTEKSAAPLWREEAEFELPVLHQGNPEKCTLYLIVMHRALVGLDKFLGQAAINLSELYDNKTRNKVGWYKLHSKSGKKEKERGEIEADIRFVRNNMTASMFDLSMKDKSRSTFGKLKDKFKGKKKDGFSDSASAIVPSISTAGDSDDEPAVTEKKKKSKLKLLFPKSNLQRTSLSQSMSVIPTNPSSPSGSAKKAKNFGSEDFTEIQLHDSAEEESSSKTLYVPKIMSHKRAASADTKQLNFTSGGNTKKDTLSLFGGLRSKSDPASQSNVCINGSHVYTEEPNQVVHVKPKPDSKSLNSSQFYTSVEDLSSKPSTDTLESSGPPPPPSKSQWETSSSEQAHKSATLPVSKTSGSIGDLSDPQRSEQLKEEREYKQGGSLPLGIGKKEMGKKTETVSASGGGAKSLNPFEDNIDKEENRPQPVQKSEVSKVDVVTKKEEAKRGGLMSLFPRKTETVKAAEKKESQNPFEDSTEEAKKPVSSSVWSSRIAAVKPKLEVSPKAETKAESLSSALPSVPHSPPFFPAENDPLSSVPAIVVETEESRDSNFARLHMAYGPPPTFLSAQSPHSSVNTKSESPPPAVKELSTNPALPLPTASSSSSSGTEKNNFSASEFVGGKTQEMKTPKRDSNKKSAQLLFQELMGKKSTANDDQWSSDDGKNDSASEMKKYEGLPEDRALETNQENERVGSELQSVYEKPDPANLSEEVFVKPRALLDLNSALASEASFPRDPPKVAPRSSLSGSVAKLNLKPSFAGTQKVPPTPAPRNIANVNTAIANDDSLHSSEDRPSEDSVSFRGNTECNVEPLTESYKVRATDVTLVAEKAGTDVSTSGLKENDHNVTSATGFEEKPSAISTLSSCEGKNDDFSATMEREAGRKRENNPNVWHGGLPVIPEKIEGSAEGSVTTIQKSKTASQPKSQVPRVPPTAVIQVQETEVHTLGDPKPDTTKNITTDSEHLGNLQLVKMEENKANNSRLQEPSISESKSGDKKIFTERRRKPFDQSPTLTNKSESSNISIKAKNDFDNQVPTETVAKLDSSEVSFSTSQSLQKNSTLKLSGESFNEYQQQTSKSSIAVPPSSTKLVGSIDSDQIEASPPLLDSVGFSVSPLSPSLSPSPVSQSTSPVTDDTPLIKPPAGSSHEVEHSGQKRQLQAWVSPTETQPIQSQNSALAVPSRRRPHPVKPMNTAETRLHEVTSEENLKTRIKNMDVMDYDPSDPAAAYAQLTHDELIQLVLKQKDIISKKDGHVRELESYIDNLLVRVMEETPNILRVAYQPNRKAERV
ncbi:rab11 family-interacting protein 1-like isoform X2 [Heptranchias perlo]|uniref:rab11 family-interacting protein 1-like isoform X2 n=1 Tax=Heptranchias perlo TaxID=212740 RepID=UPI00355A6632